MSLNSTVLYEISATIKAAVKDLDAIECDWPEAVEHAAQSIWAASCQLHDLADAMLRGELRDSIGEKAHKAKAKK